MDLDDTQKAAFFSFVEAERSTPRERRQHFYAFATAGAPGLELHHPGLPDGVPRVFEGDLETIAGYGLIRLSNADSGTLEFYVTNPGFKAYEKLKGDAKTPVHAVEQDVLCYLESITFERQYPRGFRKWKKAADLLRSADADSAHTQIGHLLREASQEFALELCAYCRVKHAGKIKTIANVRSVLEELRSRTGESEWNLLDALLVYWGTVIDLIQRQEHGTRDESEELTWEDSRRVVFQTAFVMFEMDRLARRALRG